MGACLRGELTQAGIVPAESDAPAVAATTPADEPTPAVEAETETAIAEPELDVTPPAEAQEIPEDLIAATFGLLRAEPDGSLVIAGSGTPGSEVEVYAGDELLGSTTVEPSGDWVLVPEAPIAPGGTEITLAEAGKEGRAEQSFVVVIDPNKTDQPLVVASTPGEASEILQGLETPEAGEAMDVASSDADASTPAAETGSDGSLISATEAPAAQPGTEPAGEAEDVAQPMEPQPVETEVAAAENTTEPAAVSEPAGAEEDMQTAEATVSAEPEVEPEPQSADVAIAEQPPAPAADEPAAGESIAVASVPESASTPAMNAPAAEAVEPPAVSETAAEVGSEPVTEEEPAVDAGEPANESAPAETQTAAVDSQEPIAPAEPAEPAEPAVTLADVPPTIDAIEIDGDRSFFAGAGPDGAIMRLYVDDVFVADAVVEAGRWLIEAGSILTGPQHRVRVDMLAPGSADVVSRAEVNFVVDLPETEPPVAVASAPEAGAAPVNAADVPADAPASSSEPVAEPPVTEATEPSVATQPVAPEAPQDNAVAAVEETEEPAQVADAPIEPEAPSVPAAAAETQVAEQPVAEPDSIAVAPEAPSTAVAEAPTDEEIPTLVAVPVGDPEAERFASGRAIIRRGDNLWTIARRVYGEGIKYTTIYEANADQIRDPDRIYPGQVFDLPQEAL